MTYSDELAPPGPADLFDVCARIDVSLGRNAAAMERVAAALAKPKQMQPVFYRVAQAALIPASGPLIVRLGGPDQGHMWHVKSLVVGGATPVTSTAGRADVFVSAAALHTYTTLAAIGLGDWRDQAPALPSIAFYGEGEMPLRFNEELFVAFSNATPSQQVTAVAQVFDVEEGPLEQAWTIG